MGHTLRYIGRCLYMTISSPPIPPPPPPPSEADIRQTEADSITTRIAELEADGWKRIQRGPRTNRGVWDDVGGWVWQDREGRIRDRSCIWHNKGGAPFHPDLLWRNGHACGICACTECGITQQPCACFMKHERDHKTKYYTPLNVTAEWYWQAVARA